jgi:hypothetical protein
MSSDYDEVSYRRRVLQQLPDIRLGKVPSPPEE